MGLVEDFAAARRVLLSGISAVVRRPLDAPRPVMPADFCIDKSTGFDIELTTGRLGFPDMDFPIQLRGEVVATGSPILLRWTVNHRVDREFPHGDGFVTVERAEGTLTASLTAIVERGDCDGQPHDFRVRLDTVANQANRLAFHGHTGRRGELGWGGSVTAERIVLAARAGGVAPPPRPAPRVREVQVLDECVVVLPVEQWVACAVSLDSPLDPAHLATFAVQVEAAGHDVLVEPPRSGSSRVRFRVRVPAQFSGAIPLAAWTDPADRRERDLLVLDRLWCRDLAEARFGYRVWEPPDPCIYADCWWVRVSDYGDVVGQRAGRAVRISLEGVEEVLESSLGETLVPVAVNRFGQVALNSIAGPEPRATVTAPTGAKAGAAATFDGVVLAALGDDGRAVGHREGESGPVAVVISGSGEVEELSLEAPGVATDLNLAGDVVGFTAGKAGPRAFLYRDGQVSPVVADDVEAVALSVNDGGAVAGARRDGDGWSAFLLADDETIGLGTLPGFRSAVALAVSNERTVVGTCFGRGKDSGGAASRGFRWTPGEGMRDLSELVEAESGFEVIAATAINGSGEILASAARDGEVRQVLLRPGE